MIKCGITGASGVLGSRVIKTLPFKFYIFKKDIRNKNDVENWVFKKNFDILIHLAAIVPINTVNKNYKISYDVNLNGTKNLINALIKKKKKPEWFFYASTSHVYKTSSKYLRISETNKASPQNIYGQTKVLAEKFIIKKLKNSKIKFCIGRIFSFTDKKQKIPFVIPNIIKKIKSTKKNINFKNLNHYRDFLNIKDIIAAINILRLRKKNGLFNIASGKAFNLKNIALLIADKYKKKINFIDDNDPTYLIGKIDKLKKLGWKPSKFRNNLDYFYQ